MSSKSVHTGYCPICGKSMLLKREEMEFWIALILLIFTAGIGLFIYYFTRKMNTCVQCGSPCQIQNMDHQNSLADQTISEIRGVKTKYCTFCGAEFGDRTTCPECGSKN